MVYKFFDKKSFSSNTLGDLGILGFLINKYRTSISKKFSIDKLDETDNKYNNTYHSTIKMKPVDLKISAYFDFHKENNKEDPEFEVVIM